MTDDINTNAYHIASGIAEMHLATLTHVNSGFRHLQLMQFLERACWDIPSDQLLIDKELLGPYESDGLTAFAVTPSAVVIPKTQEEVIATVQICARHKVPFVSEVVELVFLGQLCP